MQNWKFCVVKRKGLKLKICRGTEVVSIKEKIDLPKRCCLLLLKTCSAKKHIDQLLF